MSFLFAFRVPSETLRLQMAFRNDDISAPLPRRKMPLSAFAIVQKANFWSSKCNGGGISRRDVCSTGRAFVLPAYPMANACCPAHVLWPAIRSRVPSGDHLFSAVNARNFNRILRAVIRKLRAKDADRYCSHGFRRGTAQDLKTHGSHWAVVAAAGCWNSPASRGYVDLSADVEEGVRNLFTVDLDSEPD